MEKITQGMKEILRSNINYFATASRDNKPNVVPVGLVEPISDSEVMIVDVLFKKTRKNLQENPRVALAVTDVDRLQAYQFKGKAKIMASGQMFDKAFQIMKEKGERRNKRMEKRFKNIQDPELRKRYQQMMEKHKKLKPKAVVLVKVDEIYSTM